MKPGFSRYRHNPIELMRSWWPDADLSHITYNPDLHRGQYTIIRQCEGDGTCLFTVQMLQDALYGIATMQSFFKQEPPENGLLIERVEYEIGSLNHATVFGMIYLRGSKNRKYPGQKERVRMPVNCKFVYA